MSLIEKARGFLKTDGDPDEGTRDTGSEDTETAQAAHLSRCSPCESTYIDLQMEACPECGEPLEGTPNETDLGMTSDRAN